MRVPWTARRCNQSILKEISPGISLEGMMIKLKLQYFGHLMRRVDSLEKTLMLGGIGGRRRRGRQRMRWLDGITCCRKADPFQGPKLGSCLTLGDELSEETHVVTKQETLLGKGTRVESSSVREPRSTALPRGSQSRVLW